MDAPLLPGGPHYKKILPHCYDPRKDKYSENNAGGQTIVLLGRQIQVLMLHCYSCFSSSGVALYCHKKVLPLKFIRCEYSGKVHTTASRHDEWSETGARPVTRAPGTPTPHHLNHPGNASHTLPYIYFNTTQSRSLTQTEYKQPLEITR